GDGNNDVGNPTDGSGAGEGASVADVNNDGYLDLIYANQGTTNPLYEIFTGGPGTSTNRAYSIGEDPVGAITIVDTEHAITSDSGTTLDITGVTVAGGDRYLLVGVGFNDDFDQTISSVVLDPGGGSQTSLAAIAGSNAQVQDDGHTELWGVANPPTGIFTVRVTISGALTGGEALGAGAWSLAGVDQTTPLGAAATTVGDPADPLTITIASAVDDIAFAVGFVEDRTFDGINSGIQDWDNDASGDAQAGGHIAGAAGNVIIEWDISGSDKTVGSGVSVKPATGGITGLPVRVNEHEDMEWAWGDFDNDGDLDVLISGNDGEGLYENDGTGGFTDVTSAKGLSISATSGADWGDYDNDGDLDLIIANGANSILYTNNGAATYDFHATPLNGLLDITNVVGWIDYDNDGDMDIMGGEGELYRNELYDHTDLPNNPNRYLRVLPMGNATNASPDHGSPLTPIGAQIQIKNSADMSLVASSEIFAGYNNFQPPNYRHFGDIDPNAQYNVEVLFPSQTNTTILWVTPSELWNHRYNVTYSNGNYQLPQAINVTETSGNLMKYFDPMRDQVTVQDTLTFTLTRFVEDATTVDDDIVIVMRMLDETATIEDIIVKDPAAMRPQDSATVSDSLAYSLTRGTSDSVTIDDNIVIVMRMLDETATVEDIIVKDPAALRPQDSATVQDTLRYTLTRPIADAITIDDGPIRVVDVVRIQDETATVEDIIIKEPATMRPQDSAIIDDVITWTLTRVMSDSVTIDDSIRVVDVVRIQDETATVEDIIIKEPATMRPQDSATVQDTIRYTVTMRISDSVTIDDVITWTLTRRIFDEAATVEDIIVKDPAALRPQDSATVQDTIRYTVTMRISDSTTIDDGPIRVVDVVRIQDETATVEDIIVKDPAALRPQDSATVDDVITYTLTRGISDSVTIDDSIKVVNV
ncbi:MAG: FG-GAP repeat domain-containing protein, partial [Candidatus Thorarchaeota archaeon]